MLTLKKKNLAEVPKHFFDEKPSGVYGEVFPLINIKEKVFRLVLIFLFIGAGIANSVDMVWVMGSPPSRLGISATLVAFLAWPIYGIFTGLVSGGRGIPWRFPVVFWGGVIILSTGGGMLFKISENLPVLGASVAFLGACAVWLSSSPAYGFSFIENVGNSLHSLMCISVIMAAVASAAMWAGEKLAKQ